jgi:HAD superfamily hydrolase (TIGR01509 family)
MAKLPRAEKKALRVAKRGVVAFDVDGTIADTAYECYIQSMATWPDVGGKLKPSPQVEKQFLEARPLITKREHFFTVLRMIEENPSINFNNVTQAQMNEGFIRDSYKAKVFSERYMTHREAMIKKDPVRWARLNRSFPKVARAIKQARKYADIYIATTKDRKSTLELLARYGIAIPPEKVLAVDFSKDKREQLREISKRSGVPLGRIVLVEDAIEQVKAAREVGAKAMLYRRGYSTLGQKKEAQRMRVPIVDWTKKRDMRRIKRMTRK